MDNGHKTGNGVSTAICGTAPVPAEEIEAICAQFGNDKHRMLDILREVQDRYRCIAPATMDHVAAATGLTRIEVEGVASFEGEMFHTSRWNYDYTGSAANFPRL